MNEEFKRYDIKVEIPITVILETIFNTDNHDVETLSRWALKYGFVDLIERDKGKYYILQDDYKKQSFYVWLSKEERKQYDYEDYLCDELQEKDKQLETYEKENQRLNNILNELKWKPIEEYDRKKYDWVLVKYYLQDGYECIPCVAEMRYDGFWYDKDDNIIDYDIKCFFDMQLIDNLKELKESDK